MWIWVVLFLLGAYHGLNPAMGWLFAVALGLQEKSGRAVMQSLVPLSAGHLASVAAVVGLAEAVRLTAPVWVVRVTAATVLISFGIYRLLRRRHPRWVGMRVNQRELAMWSFLMSSAHGAGLMLLPFVLTSAQPAMAHSHMHHMPVSSMTMMSGGIAANWWFPVGVHTLGYVLVTASLALVIYYKVGLAVLRRAWFNLDLVWVGALITAGALTLFF